jgi:hypothetical protein
MSLSAEDLDSIYLAISRALERTGNADTPEYLARLVLLLAADVGDAAVLHQRIDEARLTPAP